MIVTLGQDTSLGAERFNARDVGDKDGDGLPEFHDAWGEPISFLRWAPGFVSDLQPDADINTPGVQRDPIGDHDPFDPRKVDPPPAYNGPPRGYRLVPLVYSSGPDQRDGIIAQSGNGALVNDPYATNSGQPVPNQDFWQDNIHSHQPPRR
jgi:hypothetical protein